MDIDTDIKISVDFSLFLIFWLYLQRFHEIKLSGTSKSPLLSLNIWLFPSAGVSRKNVAGSVEAPTRDRQGGATLHSGHGHLLYLNATKNNSNKRVALFFSFLVIYISVCYRYFAVKRVTLGGRGTAQQLVHKV